MRAGLFPGQGLEPAVVLGALPERHPLLEHADRLLEYDLRRAVQRVARRSHSVLPTDVAQPAIFVAGLIAYELATEEGTSFDYLAGHSLGEYTALVAAGAIPFSHGLRLVATRGAGMKRAASLSEGGMAAVMGLSIAQVEAVGIQAGVTFANDNSPRQAVLSGRTDALTRVARIARTFGGRTILLPVDGAYHSVAMAPAETQLAEALEITDIRSPRLPVVSNISAAPYRAPGEIRKLLLEQLTHKVRFRESIEWLADNGVTEFVDLGPGRVVGRLATASVPRREVTRA